MNTYSITVCGLDVTFSSPADSNRVEKAATFIQESYQSLQSRGNQLSKDRLLAILAVGLAVNLFELQKERSEMISETNEKSFDEKKINERLQKMLDTINSIE